MPPPEGRRRAEGSKSTRGPLVALGLVLAGAGVAAVGWFFLVSAAIDFGGQGKNDGSVLGWVLMTLATLGAVACLVLALVLVGRAAGAIGIGGRSRSPRRGHRH